MLEELLHDLERLANMKTAIEASRDNTGKIDEMKAWGIAAGMGYADSEDFADLYVLINFDK